MSLAPCEQHEYSKIADAAGTVDADAIISQFLNREKTHSALKKEYFDTEEQNNLFSVKSAGVEYDTAEAQLLSMLMNKFVMNHDTEFAFIQQYLYHKGIKSFGDKEKQAAVK